MAKKQPLEGLRITATRALQSGLKKAADILEAKIIENASLTDHTLADLEKLGHPYAMRNPRSPHFPEYQVHKQDGSLVNAVTQKKINQYAIDVGVDEARAPHVRHVIFGTRKMVARDFIGGSFKEVEEEMVRVMRDALHEGITRG